LADWRRSLERKKKARVIAPNDYLFPSATGGPLTALTLARRFRGVLRQAGLPGFKLYDLRHTYASQLLALGAPLTYVAARLGHEKPTTTLQFYSHWLPGGDQSYLERLETARHAAGDVVVTFVRTTKARKAKNS